MAQKDEMNEKLQRQREIKNSIAPFITEIRNLTDSLESILAKEPFSEADLDDAFDLNDAIQEQTQEINALLFDLRNEV